MVYHGVSFYASYLCICHLYKGFYSVYTLPTLLASVIPLSLEHLPFIPFPLYSHLMFLFFHAPGISSVLWILFSISRYISFVFLVALMNASFCMSSGHVLFLVFSFLIAWFSSFIVISSLPCDVWFLSYSLQISLTLFSIFSVHSWYAGVPGHAWYSSSYHSWMYSLVSLG